MRYCQVCGQELYMIEWERMLCGHCHNNMTEQAKKVAQASLVTADGNSPVHVFIPSDRICNILLTEGLDAVLGEAYGMVLCGRFDRRIRF